jgi:hypothetical protein
MKITKKILITTESREIFILHVNGRNNIRGFCGACAHEVGLLTLDQAVTASRIAAREIFRLSETGKIHVIETADGHLLVCSDSMI